VGKGGGGSEKEGQVTVYVHSTYAPALESGAFQKAFPEIKLVTVSGVELQLERRFTAERGGKIPGGCFHGRRSSQL
jgi:hypothetical protein